MDIVEANATYYTGTATASSSADKLTADYNDFLTMLTTQLQNQDPLSPTDTNEFTSQLVAFTQVEQTIKTNTNLQTLIDLQTISQQNNEATILIDYLGKTVGTNLSIAGLSDGEASWNMEVGAAADTVTYEVFDELGTVVYSADDPEGLSMGSQTYTWDGTTSAGGTAPEGTYYLVVTATTEGGSIVDVNYNYKGIAQSAETVNGVPVLMVDGLPVGLANIISVSVTEETNDSA